MMVDVYHDPLGTSAKADAAVLNRPLYQLDDAVIALNQRLTSASVGLVLTPYTPIMTDEDWLHIPLPSDVLPPHLEIDAWQIGLSTAMAVSFNERYVYGAADENYYGVNVRGLTQLSDGTSTSVFATSGTSFFRVGTNLTTYQNTDVCHLNFQIRDFAGSGDKQIQIDCAWGRSNGAGQLLSAFFSTFRGVYTNPNPLESIQVTSFLTAGSGFAWSLIPVSAYVIRGYW